MRNIEKLIWFGRRARNALIFFMLGIVSIHCSKSGNPDDDISVIPPSPILCKDGGYVVQFQSGDRGEIDGLDSQCIFSGQNTTEISVFPHSGFTFKHWESSDNQDLVKLEAAITIENVTEEQTWVAKYETSGLKTVWLADDLVRYSLPYMRDLAVSAKYTIGDSAEETDHEDILFYNDGKTDDEFNNMTLRNLKSDVDQSTPDGVYADSCNTEGCEAFEYLRDNEIDNLVLVHSDTSYTDDDIAAINYWIERAKSQSPNLRIFIVIPWHYAIDQDSIDSGVFHNDFSRAWGSTDEANDDLADLFAEVRSSHPELKISVIPQMVLSKRLHSSYSDDDFYVLDGSDNSHVKVVDCYSSNKYFGYFSDNKACIDAAVVGERTALAAIPGPVLSVPTALLYMSYLYGSNISAIETDQEVSIYVKNDYEFFLDGSVDVTDTNFPWGIDFDEVLAVDVNKSLTDYKIRLAPGNDPEYESLNFRFILDSIYKNDSIYNP